MVLHKEAERICRQVGSKQDLMVCLYNQAEILQTWGELDGAMALFKEQERTCRLMGYKDDLQTALSGQADVLKTRGDLVGAMELLREVEGVCRELGKPDDLAASLASQAELLSRDLRRLREALPLAEEAYRLASDHGYVRRAQKVKPVLDSIRTKLREAANPQVGD